MDELTTTALQEEEFNKKIDFKLWKRMFSYALRRKAVFAWIVILMVFVSFLDLVYPQLTRYAIDNIITKGEDGSSKLNMLEVNTTPGMTPTSFIPQQVRAAGLEMKDVLTDIIENQF